MKQKSACAVVVGVGAKRGIGAACCRRFAAEGMAVVVVGRSPHKIDAVAAELRADGATAMAVACDVTRPGDVERLFVAVDDAGWRPALLVYNVGNNVVKPFLKLTPEDIETTWRQCALGGFMVAQGAIPRMLEADAPSTMVFTGATASLRARPPFSAFAAAKAAERALAQSLAREYGPEGIHVAHVIIDGIVDGEQVDRAFKGAGRALRLAKGKNGTLQPDSVADTYWQLHQQPADAWVHELDLRPAAESF
ncbi:SDR family NAD(P)-dependent oxidoreductase [Algiphilus sp.]|uniref:SDR family NAD(P)-dependent oxidoreductase n=1 Tax=Algiphilus sp. TaxID=1872431 RepID=UPI001CA7944C|nr:SDR family NAD(P)-dependent oxidoreductase [Algiphilus sp.]MBY8964788.1 SDR family NAD(P)-dependent oxidoreductase [Algiphilus acroporae]MCI5063315.1 SDR family NAD(P)-dependent oxidoreductase [Algiphilus sp.]MCI5104078.1 SDR family NAD(P)-dependent oxidoreductase [Algiphilus sp.]MCR9092291.1 SDR family NAD(P)-dependent oxidoreductase [Pseudomonadota bacterium]